MKPVTDRAEVAIDFPDKAYMGAFGRDAAYEASADDHGIMIRLTRAGEDRRAVEFHLHYYLFADVLDEVATGLAARPSLDDAHREPLVAAVEHLRAALRRKPTSASRRRKR